MGFHLLLRFLPMFFGKRRREGKWKLSFHTLGSLVRRQDPGGITVTVVVIVVVILVTVVSIDSERDSERDSEYTSSLRELVNAFSIQFSIITILFRLDL